MLVLSFSRLVLNKSNSSSSSILISKSQLLIRHFSSENVNSKSFTLSYLINSCNLTPDLAESVSKKVNFESSEKPDLVLAFLKNHGLNDTQITRIIRQRPKVLLAQPETSFLPKIEFLRSVGASSSDLSIMISNNPELLTRTLDKYLIPRYNLLKKAVNSDPEKVVKALKHLNVLSMSSMRGNFDVNLSVLRDIGISQSSIDVLVAHFPYVLCGSVSKFANIVKKAMDMGFEPSNVAFVRSLPVFLHLNDETWEHKMGVYRKCGFSEDEILSIFRKNPHCMIRPEKKIVSIVDFLVCKMGWQIADMVTVPIVFTSSLEGRIMPRCSVARVLFLKGLISKEDVSLSSVLMPTDANFVERFVVKFQTDVPELLDLFHGKVNLEDLGFGENFAI